MATAAATEPPPRRAARRALWSWALYDWANSPFTTIIITFVFSAYFVQGIVKDPIRGTALWGYATSAAGIGVALLSPVLGAVADVAGRRKPWLAAFSAMCVVGAFFLWFAEPDPAYAPWAMVWLVIATLGFEFGIVFNNAMLPDLVEDERLGRWSGWAWGLGYFGGLAAMVLALFAFIQPQSPLFGLDKASAEHVRVVGPLCGLWFVAFVWPLFVFTPDVPATGVGIGQAMRAGLRTVVTTLKNVRQHGNIIRFLVARMLYNDGLTTVFAFGGIYAAGTFGMSLDEVIKFGLLLNVTAGLGAAGFAWLDDWLGSRATILVSLIGLIATATWAVLTTDVKWFWIAGAALGIFVGPAQAASRSFMARLAPANMRTEFFGLYALTGKAIAFLGPWVVATVTSALGSQRAGMGVVVVFFSLGLAVLLTVRER